MSETTSRERFNPLQKIMIGAIATGALYFGIARGCNGSPENEAERAIPTSTTSTTKPEVVHEPYWKKFGWDYDIDREAMRRNLLNNLDVEKGFYVAAGRCVVNATEVRQNRPPGLQSEPGWEIIKNPIVTRGFKDPSDKNSHSFTVFSGYMPYVHVSEPGDEQMNIDTPYATIIDGQLQWGAIGVVPKQSLVTDTDMVVGREGDELSQPQYVAARMSKPGETVFAQNVRRDAGGIQGGEVVFIPKRLEYLVSQECVLAGSVPKPRPID